MLPAYAGMILHEGAELENRVCAPRVCGDDPAIDVLVRGFIWCSPRMRG